MCFKQAAELITQIPIILNDYTKYIMKSPHLLLYKGLWLVTGNWIIRITEPGFLKSSVSVYSNVNEFQEAMALDYHQFV